jgi:flagellar assembly protein FliH
MSKVIPHAELGALRTWQLPHMDEAPGTAPVPTNPDLPPEPAETAIAFPTAEEIEEIERQAREEGFAAGYKEGLAQARSEIAARANTFEQLTTALCQPFAELDQQVEQELVALAIAIARQIIRREIKTSPGEVVAVVREAIAALPVGKRSFQVYLHPEDARLVREALALSEEERPWRIIEDSVLTRGGCKVATETSSVDASVEKRLGSVIAQLLGTEREQDRQPA